MSKQAIYIVFLAGLLSLVSGDAVAQLRTETDNRVETVTFGFNWGWGGGRYWNGGSWWGGNGGWWSGPWGRFYQGWNPGFHPGWNGGGVSTGWSQIGWGDQGRFFWRCPWNTIGYWGGGCWGCGTWFCQGCNYPSCPPCQFWDPSRGSCIPAFQGCGNIPDCGVCSFFDPSYNNGQGACIQAQGCGQSYGCANCYNTNYNYGYGNNWGPQSGGPSNTNQQSQNQQGPWANGGSGPQGYTGYGRKLLEAADADKQ